MSPLAVHQVLNTAELLSMILVSLRDRVQEDQGIDCSSDEQLLDDSQVKWKAVVKDIAFVDPAFFHATADIIWEHMHGLEPFLSLLGLSNADTEPSAYSAGITKAAWQRFQLYSSRTKSLMLGVPKPSHSVNSWWAYYLTTSNGRRDTIFPALKNLYLNSIDNVSMMIALSTLSRLKLLQVDLGSTSERLQSKDAVKALTAALAEAPGSISILRFVQPVDAQCIRNLSQLRELTRLRIAISPEDVEAVGPNFWCHEQVVFDEAFRDDEHHDDTLQHLGGLDKFGKNLLLLSGSTLQSKIASRYSESLHPSHPLDTVFLNFVYTGSDLENLPSMATIQNYVSCNPGLKQLHMISMSAKNVHPQALNRARSNPVFNNPRPFFSLLASSHNLESLTVTGIIVGHGDIIMQAFGLLKHLPRLAVFIFMPLGSSATTDGLLLPGLEVLADIPKYNPLMYSLGVFVELSAANLPDLATLHPSGDHLSTLGLFPGVPYRFPRYSTKDLLAVAMYLYRLFPNLEEIMKLPGAVDTEMNVFWEAVDEAMQSFHRVRRLTTRKINASLSQ